MRALFEHCYQLACRAALLPTLSPMLVAAATTIDSKSDSLLIRNVYVISATAELSASPLNVLIEDGRIRAIGKEEYSAAEVLEGRQQYLIPGLIDTHVHLGGVPGFIQGKDSDSAIYQRALAQIPRSYLYFGFTTLQKNPLTDISAYNSVTRVVLNGLLIARESLASSDSVRLVGQH